MKLLEIKNLNFNYNEVKLLQNINFTLETGDFLCVSGKMGSGKSTLLKIISEILPVNDGSVIFYTKKICYIPQNISNFFVSSFVLDDLLFSLKNAELRTKQKKELIEKVLKNTKLVGYENRLISSLSGGEKEKLALAASLVKNPEILILDNSFCFLDENSADELMDILINYKNQNKNFSIIFASNDSKIINKANKIIKLDNI